MKLILSLTLSLTFALISPILASPGEAAGETSAERTANYELFAGDRPQAYIGWAQEWTEEAGKVSEKKEIVTLGLRRQFKNREVTDTQYYAEPNGNAKKYQYRFKYTTSLTNPGYKITVIGEKENEPIAVGSFKLKSLPSENGPVMTCEYGYETESDRSEGKDTFSPRAQQSDYARLYHEKSTTTNKMTGVITHWEAHYFRISDADYRKAISFDKDGAHPKVDFNEVTRLKQLLK